MISCWLILLDGVFTSEVPVTFALGTTVQVYVVPTGTITEPLFCGLTVKIPPLHTVANWLGITGVGFTETVIKNGVPIQLPLVGVTSYTIS